MQIRHNDSIKKITKESYFNSNSEVNKKAFELESSFIFYLWAMRYDNIIKDVKITKLSETNSFFSFKENTLDIIKDLGELKEGEGMLIKLKYQNAFLFDCGLIVKNKINYSLYLFQVTLRKEAKERFTVEGLNESIYYLNCFLYTKLNIIINSLCSHQRIGHKWFMEYKNIAG